MRPLRPTFRFLPLLLAVPALADGIAFKGRDLSSLRPAQENEQVALVSQRDGRERMFILCQFDADEVEKGLWVFPVLGAPAAVSVDLCDRMPVVSGGVDPIARAREDLGTCLAAAAATQAWPMPAMCLLSAGLLKSGVAGLAVYSVAEKWGIRAEVLQADSIDALRAHLAESGASVPEASIEAFAPYVGPSRALVAAWVSSAEEVKAHFGAGDPYLGARGHSPCLYVEFPSERPFYPMRPTASYGEVRVPLRLYVLGWSDPTCVEALRRRMKVNWYVHGEFYRDLPAGRREADREEPGPAWFKGEPESELRYTLVTCDAEASAYTEDLRFDEARVPGKLRYAMAIETIAESVWLRYLVFFFVVAFLSYVAAGLVGRVLHGRWRGIAVVGLWNVLTIAGVLLAIHLLRGERGDLLRKTTRPEGRGFTTFVWFFSFVYLALCVVVYGLLLLPLI